MNFLRILPLLFFSFFSLQIVAAWQPKFKVGDKVVAQNLRATGYNGAIGEIRTVPKDSSGRYGVLFNDPEKPLGLKEENLKKYESIDDILDAVLAEMDGGAPQAAPARRTESSQGSNPQDVVNAIFGNPNGLNAMLAAACSMLGGGELAPGALKEAMNGCSQLFQALGGSDAERVQKIMEKELRRSDSSLNAEFNERARELRASLREGLNRLRALNFSEGTIPEGSRGFSSEEAAKRNNAMENAPFTPQMQGSDCPICLEGLTAEKAIVTPDCSCRACYHKECLEAWLATASSCPTCRKNFR